MMKKILASQKLQTRLRKNSIQLILPDLKPVVLAIQFKKIIMELVTTLYGFEHLGIRAATEEGCFE
jgi:hypothetical protein